MNSVCLSKYAVKILKIIKNKETSINDLAYLFNKSPISSEISGYMIYLYKEGYIKKYMYIDEDKPLNISEKTTLTVKGIEYLNSLKQEKVSFIRKSIIVPIFITIVTFILCKYLEKFF